jgi:hypothetical protein
MGGQTVVNAFPEVNGNAVIGLCPRRTVLDKVLVDAAVEPAPSSASTSRSRTSPETRRPRLASPPRERRDPVIEEARIVIGATACTRRLPA